MNYTSLQTPMEKHLWGSIIDDPLRLAYKIGYIANINLKRAKK
jgi:hypothetical protein